MECNKKVPESQLIVTQYQRGGVSINRPVENLCCSILFELAKRSASSLTALLSSFMAFASSLSDTSDVVFRCAGATSMLIRSMLQQVHSQSVN